MSCCAIVVMVGVFCLVYAPAGWNSILEENLKTIAAVLALVVVIANQLKVETQRDGVLCCLILSSPVLCSVRQALWHGSNQCTNSLGRPTNRETKLRTFVVNRLTPYRLRWCAPSSHTIPLLSLVRMSAHGFTPKCTTPVFVSQHLRCL